MTEILPQQHTNTHIHPAANTLLRYVVCFCGELHFAYQLPLSFKNFYFPNLNMLIWSQLSFTATWYPLPANSCQTSASLCSSLSVYLPFGVRE